MSLKNEQRRKWLPPVCERGKLLNLTTWPPSSFSYGIFTPRPRVKAWPTPKFSSFMSPLEKLDLGTFPVCRWGVEATVHAKQARTNCVWDKRVQTRKCTAGALNRPSYSSQNTAAWGRCWSWTVGQMVIGRYNHKTVINIRFSNTIWNLATTPITI